MLSNAYILANFRFDTAENEPAKKLSFPLALGSIHFPPRLRLRRERPGDVDVAVLLRLIQPPAAKEIHDDPHAIHRSIPRPNCFFCRNIYILRWFSKIGMQPASLPVSAKDAANRSCNHEAASQACETCERSCLEPFACSVTRRTESFKNTNRTAAPLKTRINPFALER